MINIKHDDMCLALYRWDLICDPVECSGTLCFLQFVGISGQPWDKRCDDWADWVFQPESAAKIKMLLGPHYETIIKAWCAKHGVDTK